MLRFLAIALGPFLCASVAQANGGGYTFGVSFTGSLAPFQPSGTEHVQILDEKLEVTLRRADASVRVLYSMRNHADAPVVVRFGFPVEAIERSHSEHGWSDDPVDRQALVRALGRAVQQLKGYSVTADGASVAAEFSVEPFTSGKIAPFAGSEALRKIAGWMVSQITFPPRRPVAVEIRYAAAYSGQETFVSDDELSTPLSFVYRLSTGAVWNGPIERGTVVVQADGIPMEEVEIISPANRFKREAGRWVWAFAKLEPTLADDIKVESIPGFREVGVYRSPEDKGSGPLSYIERRGAFGEAHKRFKARASSSLTPAGGHDFGPEHLAEPFPPKAPWAEGVEGNGIGEWVELTLDSPRPLLGLRVAPGFPSVEHRERFEESGRPAKVELLLNGEHRFIAGIPDGIGAPFIPVVNYAKAVSKVRITILDVYQGTKYSDTCISNVTLYDRLKKRPEMRGAR